MKTTSKIAIVLLVIVGIVAILLTIHLLVNGIDLRNIFRSLHGG